MTEQFGPMRSLVCTARSAQTLGFICWFCEIESHYVAQVSLEFTIFLPQLPHHASSKKFCFILIMCECLCVSVCDCVSLCTGMTTNGMFTIALLERRSKATRDSLGMNVGEGWEGKLTYSGSLVCFYMQLLHRFHHKRQHRSIHFQVEFLEL